MSRPRFQGPANFGGMRPMFSGPPNMNGPGAGPAPPRYGGFPNQFQSQPPRQRQPNNIWCGRPPQMNYRPQFRNANPGQFQHPRNPNQNNFQNGIRLHQNNFNQNQNFNKRKGQYHDRDNPVPHGNHQNNQRNQFQNNKKKQKVNKRDTEEHNNFFCDTCDRGFKAEDKYKEHLNQHQKCTHSGCPYIAAPKLVQLHIRLQHSNGLAKKIWQLESKEDIEKWRAERRKNFPTEENRMKKETEQEDKKSRGEVVETKCFGKMKGRNQRNKRQNNRKRQYNETRQQDSDASKQESEDICKQNDANKKLKTEDSATKIEGSDGDPLSLLINDNSDSGEDDDPSTTESAAIQGDTVKDNIIGGLGMIVSSYDDEEEEEEDNLKEQENISQKQASKSVNQERKKFNKNNKKAKRDLHNKKQKNNNGNQRRKTSSLLEKLLAKEIRHERNVVLQCVYHIIRNDFFQIHENKSFKTTHVPAMTDIDDKVCD